jgi:GNAT superfamily N-acetyltransferase
MEIKLCCTEKDFELAFPVMKELRSHLNYDKFRNLITAAQEADRYQIYMAMEDNQVLGVMGVRVLFDLVHGKHLYIDDLVTTEFKRSMGVGSKLLKFSEQLAKSLGCNGLRLCTGIENEKGKSFYEREARLLKSVAYKKTINY